MELLLRFARHIAVVHSGHAQVTAVDAKRNVAIESNRGHWWNELRILRAHRRHIVEGGGERAAGVL